jgi:hypothetical protein
MIRRKKPLFHSPLLVHDVGIIVLSVLIALILMRTDILVNILTSTKELEFLGSFIAGLFFTSIFTTAPAIVTLGEISQASSILGTAFFGTLGAVVGDLIIFRFVEDRLSAHFVELLKEEGVYRRTKKLAKAPLFKWLTFIIGGAILASPLPDELGISILGASKMRASRFAAMSFVFNFVGIVIIGLIARSML